MNHDRSPLPLALFLSCFFALAIGCGSVQGSNDGSAGGTGGTGNGGTGAGGVSGGAGTMGNAGTTGAGGTTGVGGVGGVGGAGGRGGSDGAVKCGMATCTAGQVCCNASCGLCTPPGVECVAIACSDLRWYSTCGTTSICPRTDAGPPDSGSSLQPCTAEQKLDSPCPTLGQMCDPRDNACGRVLVCATSPFVCPF